MEETKQELSLEKFNPTIAELQKAVEATKGITVTDLKDKAQLAIVKENRINLRNMRILITKTGKQYREDAIKFQKTVIEKERELIAIIEPEEDRLGKIEEEAAILAEREKRRDKLPWRKEQLVPFTEEIKDRGLDLSDENEILSVDDDEFKSLLVELQEAKNRKESDRLAEERRAIDAEKARIDRQKEVEVEKEKAILAERERAQKAESERKEREEREAKESEAKKKRDEEERVAKENADREAADRKAKEDQERLEANRKFAKFKTDNGWTEQTKDQFREERVGNEVILWRRVGVFKIIK